MPWSLLRASNAIVREELNSTTRVKCGWPDALMQLLWWAVRVGASGTSGVASSKMCRQTGTAMRPWPCLKIAGVTGGGGRQAKQSTSNDAAARRRRCRASERK